MSWVDGTWIALDTETTGIDVTTDRIVTATIVIRPAGGEPEVTAWLADPGIEIAEAAVEVHKITAEHAREFGRPAAEVVAEIADLLAEQWRPDVPILGYNLAFDLGLLDAEMRRHLGRPLTVHGPVVDGLVLDKAVDRYRKGSRKLIDACAHYGVRLDADKAHDATEDALAAARVIWRIARRYPARVGQVGLVELHDQQRGWYAEQQLSLAGYFRDKLAPQLHREARALAATDPDASTAKAAEADQVAARAAQIAADTKGWPVRGAA